VKLLNSMAVAYWVRNPWEENRILMQGNGAINTARMLADCLSTSSLKEIQERVERKNYLATLRLADCYMYGLKGLRRDGAMALELYQDAAALGSLEARIQVAKLIYDRIIEACANGEDAQRTSFPIQRENSEGHDMKVFWSHLEVAADFDYVTPFMIDMLVAAKKTGSWPLSNKFENILARFETQLDAEIRSEKASYKFPCRAARCSMKFNDQALMVVCGQCKLVISRQNHNTEIEIVTRIIYLSVFFSLTYFWRY
jgi:hypothetical protein